MTASSVNQGTKCLDVSYDSVSIGVSSDRLPALFWIDQRTECGPFEPHGDLVDKCGETVTENEFGEVAVVDAGNWLAVGEPGLHVR